MESRRTAKSRSSASESQTSTLPSERPDLGERGNSAPSTSRRRESHSKHAASARSTPVSRNSAKSRTSERSLPRDDLSSARPEEHPSTEVWRQPEFLQFPPRRLVQCALHVDTDQLQIANSNVISLAVAVVGSDQTGKSTFIQLALGRSQPPSGPVSVGKMSLEGVVYRLHLVELLTDDIHFTGGLRLKLPVKIGDVNLPTIDGIICLYDVSQEESIADVPELLSACCTSQRPTVAVAWKSDAPNWARKVPQSFNSRLQSAFPAVELCETSKDSPDGARRCILTILKPLSTTSSSPSCSPTSPQLTRPRHQSQSTTNNVKDNLAIHVRSKSELPTSKSDLRRSTDKLASMAISEALSVRKPPERKENKANRGLAINTAPPPVARQNSHESPTPPSSNDFMFHGLVSPTESRDSETPQTPESLFMATTLRPGTADTSDTRAHRTFLDLGVDSHEDSSSSESNVPEASSQHLQGSATPRDEFGSTFDDLLDQLLMLPQTKQEVKFVPKFLCLYRAFATPMQLLSGVLSRFDDVDKSKDVGLTKAGEQLRYLQVLAQWTGDYPEDFAIAGIRSTLTSFLSQIGRSKIFMGAAKEISNNLDTRTRDEDMDWAYTDASAPQSPVKNRLSVAKAGPHPGTKVRSPSIPSSSESTGSPEVDFESSPRNSSTPSNASSQIRIANASSQSQANILALEQARNKAAKLKPVPRNRLTKIEWHLLMETSSSDFAIEVTRIDWNMYRSIRPRDFVRHVVLPSADKRTLQPTDHIGMMVKQFNHLALFVSSMILLREKPKHRAKALEKFMDIAWKVRQMNNYNALGAIVAGINGPEIQRLGITRDLIPHAVQKNFLRLTILMSHSRSHSAYRMAWDNSVEARIPFIPLVRQDLTRAELGNRTWLGPNNDRIHWKKFQVMGEVVLALQNSQQFPYTFPKRAEEVLALILHTRVLEGPEVSTSEIDSVSCEETYNM